MLLLVVLLLLLLPLLLLPLLLLLLILVLPWPPSEGIDKVDAAVEPVVHFIYSF